MDNYLLDLEEDLGFTEFRKRYVVAEELIHQEVSQSLITVLEFTTELLNSVFFSN